MVGSTLNHYRIVKALGSGGMGDVYLADDTRLKRQIAIKILPAALAAQPDRLERFEREAQAVAALTHPNIVTLYSVEDAGDTHFLTLEYVEGRTLVDVKPKGGLPLKRLLTIALQIVDAVIAAHDRGIVHRDLKPANVMVTAGDRVKVLDFGLAKLRETADEAAMAGMPTREITGEGKIVGTVAYMSPEQAEGKPIDARSDIFSMGVMLYELSTGTLPFGGDTTLSVLTSILRDTPKAVTDVNPALPPDLARIVRRCLVKESDRRYQSARDLRNDLDEIDLVLESGGPALGDSAMRSTRRAVLAIAVVLALVGVLSWCIIWLRGNLAASQPPPIATFTKLTQLAGQELFPSISPDGKWFVYASRASGNLDIYLRSVGGQTAINLTKDSPAADFMPAFSPDGESIAFRSERDGGGIFVMGRTGESVRRLLPRGYFPSWFPDGKRVVASDELASGMPEGHDYFSDLWAVDLAAGEPHQLGMSDAVQPKVSPHARRIAFWGLPTDPATKAFTSANRDVWTVNIDGTRAVRVTDNAADDWNPEWSADGESLYFLSNRGGSMNLWRVSINETTGIVSGTPQPITIPAAYVAHFALAADGRTGIYSAREDSWIGAKKAFDARTGTTDGQVVEITKDLQQIALADVTTDGTRFVAVMYSSQRRQEDIVVVNADGSGVTQLTNDGAQDRNPRWSVDAKRIFFHSNRSGPYEVWSIEADGSGLHQITSGGDHLYPVPSHDGTRLAVGGTGRLLVYDARDFTKPPERLPSLAVPPGRLVYPLDWSPDGSHLLVAADSQAWMYSRDDRTYRPALDNHGPGGVRLLADGRLCVLALNGAIAIADTTDRTVQDILRIAGERVNFPLLSGRDSLLIFTRVRSESDVWMVRFGDQK
jgi:Tol biopolymer transport system component